MNNNTATYTLNTNELKVGKANLNSKQIERISFLLAHDLKTFALALGDLENLTATAVYSHLKDNL